MIRPIALAVATATALPVAAERYDSSADVPLCDFCGQQPAEEELRLSDDSVGYEELRLACAGCLARLSRRRRY